MSRHIVRLPLFFALLIAGAVSVCAEQAPEYEVKAEFLERFTRFIDWPSDPPGRFVIGVIGRNPFNGFIERIASERRIKGRLVDVRYVSDVAQLDACQLVFIAASERAQLPRILARTASKPILTVADSDGFANAGVMINFYKTGDTVRFEVNESAVERSGLKVSSKLLKLARLVGADER